jgi:uncharacterized membrane protein HdeD (DUF308 family)
MAGTFLLGGLEEIRRHWFGYLCLGIALLVVGTLALGATVVVTLATAIFLGWLMVIGGILEAGHAFWRRAWSGFFFDLLIGLLYAVVGFMFIARPGLAAETLTLFIAVMLLIGGLFRIAVAISAHFRNWGWILLNGVIDVVLGIMILNQWPESGLWVIGLFVGIDMIFNGWSLIMLALAARSVPEPAAR